MKHVRLKTIVPLLDERDCLNMFQNSYHRYPLKKKGVSISLENARMSSTGNYDDYMLIGSMCVKSDQKLTYDAFNLEIRHMREAFVLEYYRRFNHVLNPYYLRYKIVKKLVAAEETTIYCEYVITLSNRNTNL